MIDYEGCLEVYRFGIWGIVCDINMDNKMVLKMVVVVCWFLGLFWYNKRKK